MNKSIIYSILMGFLLLVACDPVESRDKMTGAITADQLDIKVTPEVVNGVRSNKLILENNSPVLSFWNYGVGTTAKAYDEVLVTSVGDILVTFTGRNGDGSTLTKEITVNVEAIVYEVTGMDKFIGDGSKTWVFDAFTDNNHPYGIGGAVSDFSPTWWGPEYGEFDEWDASMTFALDGGAIFTKTLSNGTQQKGTFSFNLSKKVGTWSQGTLSLNGATIPNAYSVNKKAGEAFDFYILVLEDDQMVLANMSGNGIPDDPGSGSEANFWMFRPEGYTATDNTEQMEFLTGGTEKVWTWVAGNEAFGNNSPTASAPGWWVLPRDGSIDEQVPGEGTGATMTFSMDGTLTKKRNDGTESVGSYKVNMGKFVEGWSIGTLQTTDVTVLAGVAFVEDKIDISEYSIISLDENNFVLGYVSSAKPDEGYYWVFAPQNE